MAKDVREVLWENVDVLMERRFGKRNLQRTARESGVGEATMNRIKAMERLPRLDSLEALASFFGVPLWALLRERSDLPSEPAAMLGRQFDALAEERKPSAYALIVQILEFGNTGTGPTASPAPTDEPDPPPGTPPAAGQASQRTRRAP